MRCKCGNRSYWLNGHVMWLAGKNLQENYLVRQSWNLAVLRFNQYFEMRSQRIWMLGSFAHSIYGIQLGVAVQEIVLVVENVWDAIHAYQNNSWGVRIWKIDQGIEINCQSCYLWKNGMWYNRSLQYSSHRNRHQRIREPPPLFSAASDSNCLKSPFLRAL